MRILVSLAASQDLEIAQFDVKTAFLNGTLEEVIYMECPQCLNIKDNEVVCRLKKSLYGLKQASLVWNKEFSKCLQRFNLSPSAADPCVFGGKIKGHHIYLLLYVDDGLILSSSKELTKELLSFVQDNFDITIGDGRYYVGMEISRNRKERSIAISQRAYIDEIQK